jgi:hypothetical protein
MLTRSDTETKVLSTKVLSTTILSATELWKKVLSTEVWSSKVIQSFLYTLLLLMTVKSSSTKERVWDIWDCSLWHPILAQGSSSSLVGVLVVFYLQCFLVLTRHYAVAAVYQSLQLHQFPQLVHTIHFLYTVDLGLVLPFYLVVLLLSE